MKKNRVLCALLAVAMLLSLCACGASNEAVSTPSSSVSEEASTPTEAAPVPEEAQESVAEAEPVAAYPHLEEPTTYTFWYPASNAIGTYIEGWGDNVVFQKMAELTNISFDFTTVASSTAGETFSLMVASEDYTDLIYGFGDYYPESMDSAINDEVILDLSELAAQHAPDYYNYIMADTSLEKLAVSDSGKLWGLHRVNEEKQIGIGLMIRQDWLKGVNAEMPSTYDELETALLAIKNEYAPKGAVMLNSNGFIDLFGADYALSAGFEIGTIGTPFINKDGTAVYTPATEGWKAYLAEMASWYQQGILNQDFPSLAGPDFFNGISTCSTAMFSFFYDQCGNFVNTCPDPEVDVVGMPYPTVNEGDELHLMCLDPQIRIGMSVVLSSVCADPEILLQYFNYLWTEEGQILANYGIEGEHFTFEDGKPVLTESRLNDETTFDDVYTYRAGPVLVLQDYFAQTLDPKCYDCLTAWTSNNDGSYVLPDITFTADESYEISSIEAELNTYVSEYTLKVICGETDLDATWDEYLANLDSMGYNTVQDTYQVALDRYFSK